MYIIHSSCLVQDHCNNKLKKNQRLHDSYHSKCREMHLNNDNPKETNLLGNVFIAKTQV